MAAFVWLFAFGVKPPFCPRCLSAPVVRIVYGLVRSGSPTWESARQGKIVMGGCVVDWHSPYWVCKRCGLEGGLFLVAMLERGVGLWASQAMGLTAKRAGL